MPSTFPALCLAKLALPQRLKDSASVRLQGNYTFGFKKWVGFQGHGTLLTQQDASLTIERVLTAAKRFPSLTRLTVGDPDIIC